MKKRTIVGIVLFLCLLCGNYALAVSHTLAPFSVALNSAKYVASEAKIDNQQKWFVTILSMSLTENDDLYMNVRDGKYGNRLSNALRFTAPAAKSANYKIKTSEGQRIYLHAQLGSENWTPDSFANVTSGRWTP